MPEARLTPALFEVFLRYKKATAIVIKWLANASQGQGKISTNKWSLKELTQAAKITKSTQVEVPRHISCAFEIAIGARTEITAYFKQQMVIDTTATHSHEHFTNTLRSIFKDLCGSQGSTASKSPLSVTHQATLRHSENPYDVLTTTFEAELDISSKSTFGGETGKAIDESHDESFSLKDDGLAVDFELYYVVANLDLTCNRVKSYWEKVATGSMPLVFAAFLTTAAVENARFCFNDGPSSKALEVKEHSALVDRHNAFVHASLIDAERTSSLFLDKEDAAYLSSHVFLHGLGLYNPWRAILEHKAKGTDESILQANPYEKVEDFVTVQKCASKVLEQTGAELDMMRALLIGLRKVLLPREYPKSSFIYSSNPLAPDLLYFCGIEGRSVRTSFVFGLQLLVESYKSYVHSKEGTKAPNCRILTLKFAQDVRRSLNHLEFLRTFRSNGGCKCDNCGCNDMVSQLQCFEASLSAIVKESRFDLYNQAPWVSGSQMMGILDDATTLGVRLCNRGQYVGAVLHLYNLLRKLGSTDEILLLENLCTVLIQGVFRGQRPERSFYSQYALYAGGRLEFDKTKRPKNVSNRDGTSGHGSERTWRIAMPKFLTKSLDWHQLSILTGLYHCAFRLNCHNWAHVWHGIDKHKKTSIKEVESAAKGVQAHPFVCALDHLERVVGTEFEGELPNAKINWFEVYLTCTEILGNVSKACIHELDHPCPDVPEDDERWIDDGQHTVEGLLFRTEDFSDNITKSRFVSDECVTIMYANNAIRSALKGKNLADYLWNI